MKNTENAIANINKIIELAISSYNLVVETIGLYRNANLQEKQRLHEQLEIRLDLLLEKIEELSDGELSMIKLDGSVKLNEKVISEILALKSKVKDIDSYMGSRNYEKIKDILGQIINLARIELKDETTTKKLLKRISRAPLFNGTNLAVIFAVLTFSDGLFGLDRTFFYIKQEDAEYYSKGTNVLSHVREIYRNYGKDFDSLFSDEQKRQMLKGFILEFDQDKVGEVKFNDIEEGRIEFVFEGRVSLSNLTKRCKNN